MAKKTQKKSKALLGDATDITRWFNSFVAHAGETLATVAKSPAVHTIAEQLEDGALATLHGVFTAQMQQRGVPPVLSGLLDNAEQSGAAAIKAAVNKQLGLE